MELPGMSSQPFMGFMVKDVSAFDVVFKDDF